ncbi:MAG TPA: DUF1996 domain-containing protein [Actinomycetota bacterium]|nr:DUF1996 domain-containing protein [Actinomycetota bacterium]
MRRLILTALLTVPMLTVGLPNAQAAPGWITTASYSHSNHDDPIVHPGVQGAAHLHDFACATTTDAFSTPLSLRAGGTTCAMPDDESAYWVPALYEDGQRRLPAATAKNSLFYYRRVAIASAGTVTKIPDGLNMVIGNAKATSPSENPQLGTDIIFKCGPGSSTDLPQPPAQCDSGVMVTSIRFPNCWDGWRLDSPNHRDHMSYPVNSRCPASHPVNIPRVEGFWRYNVGTGPIGTISFSSGPWYTIHQDFFNAWRPPGLQRLMDACINGLKDCGANPTL